MTDLDEKKEVIAIIPARGGSKGIPRKNIVDLCGKPLIAYSIQAALKSKLITRVIVSTEDEEIAQISEHYGATVPFLRPGKFSEDHSSLGDVVKHVIGKIETTDTVIKAYMVLLPTHPFRSWGMIDFLLSKLISDYKIVRTVKPIDIKYSNYLCFNQNNDLIPFFSKEDRKDNKFKNFVRTYGVFNGVNLSNQFNSLIYLHYLTDPVTLIDIDYKDDLILAREVIKNNWFDFNSEAP